MVRAQDDVERERILIFKIGNYLFLIHHIAMLSNRSVQLPKLYFIQCGSNYIYYITIPILEVP